MVASIKDILSLSIKSNTINNIIFIFYFPFSSPCLSHYANIINTFPPSNKPYINFTYFKSILIETLHYHVR